MTSQSPAQKKFAENTAKLPEKFSKMPIYQHWAQQPASPTGPAILLLTEKPFFTPPINGPVLILPPKSINDSMTQLTSSLKTQLSNYVEHIAITLKKIKDPHKKTRMVDKPNLEIVADVLIGELKKHSQPAPVTAEELSAKQASLANLQTDLKGTNYKAKTTAINSLKTLQPELSALGVKIEKWEDKEAKANLLQYAQTYCTSAAEAVAAKLEATNAPQEAAELPYNEETIQQLFSPTLPFIPNPKLFAYIVKTLHHAATPNIEALTAIEQEAVENYSESFKHALEKINHSIEDEKVPLITLGGESNRDKLKTLIEMAYKAPTPSETIDLINKYVVNDENTSTISALVSFILTQDDATVDNKRKTTIDDILGDKKPQYQSIMARINAYSKAIKDNKTKDEANILADDQKRTDALIENLQIRLNESEVEGKDCKVQSLIFNYLGVSQQHTTIPPIYIDENDSEQLKNSKNQLQAVVNAIKEHNASHQKPVVGPYTLTITTQMTNDGPDAGKQ